uniref:glycine dehydrogenase (aminomethyl-transferring) n=1 Tax=Acrobeloides nanus TaxID=290746 RepID=A0A914DZF0_9BILA
MRRFKDLRCISPAITSASYSHGVPIVISRRSLNYDTFADRHIGPSDLEKQRMLQFLGFKDLDHLTNTNVPEQIRLKRPLDLPPALDEWRMLTELREISDKNKNYRTYIGMGYYDCIVPNVIIRNVLQNAGWTSPYTPYQPEIAQGRLESLLNFQTMIADLTGLEIANASLLDEATACAEAICLASRVTKRFKILYDPHLHPQNIALLRTRAEPLDIDLIPLTDVEGSPSVAKDIAGVIVQYPNTEGKIYDLENLIKTSHENGALVIMVCDLLSLTLLKSPGDLGADIAVGNAQRFGLPLGYGGPHPAFMAVAKRDEKNSLARTMPGRIVGVSKLVYKALYSLLHQSIQKSLLNSVPWIDFKKLDMHGLMVRTLTIHVIVAGEE